MDRFTRYMKRTWLKNDEYISQWNVFGERHRLNNVVESWHSTEQRSEDAISKIVVTFIEHPKRWVHEKTGRDCTPKPTYRLGGHK